MFQYFSICAEKDIRKFLSRKWTLLHRNRRYSPENTFSTNLSPCTTFSCRNNQKERRLEISTIFIGSTFSFSRRTSSYRSGLYPNDTDRQDTPHTQSHSPVWLSSKTRSFSFPVRDDRLTGLIVEPYETQFTEKRQNRPSYIPRAVAPRNRSPARSSSSPSSS